MKNALWLERMVMRCEPAVSQLPFLRLSELSVLRDLNLADLAIEVVVYTWESIHLIRLVHQLLIPMWPTSRDHFS